MSTVRSVLGKSLEVSQKYLEAIGEGILNAEKLCKVCGEPGLRVLPVTVSTHVDVRYWEKLGDGFRFSDTPNCPVVYYNNARDIYFTKEEVRTRFGPKEKESPRPICYCLQVTEERIAEEILGRKCCYSLQDIVSYTKAGTGKWCLTTNPSGKCCRDYLPSIVEKYLVKVGREPPGRELEEIRQKLQAEEPLKEVVLSVKGMTCESCAVSVKSMLEHIGAKEVTVSLQKEEARLQVPTTTAADEVVKAVDDLGYRASVSRTTRL